MVRCFHVPQTTCINSDALYQVAEATLEPYAEMLRLAPRLAEIDLPPELSPGVPRFRCIFFVEDEHDPIKKRRVRLRCWCMPDAHSINSLLERGYSRAIAKQVIPLLVSDINGLKNAEEATLKFQMIVGAPDVVGSFLNVSGTGAAGDDDEELFQQRVGQLFSECGWGDQGSGS